MARRTTWLIDMGDGTWSVCCMACRIALYRGSKAGADRTAAPTPANPSSPSAASAGRPTRHPSPGGRRHPGPTLDGRAAHRQPHHLPTHAKEHAVTDRHRRLGGPHPPAGTSPQPGASPSTTPYPSRRRVGRWLYFALTAAGFLTVAGFHARPRRPHPRPVGPGPARHRPWPPWSSC